MQVGRGAQIPPGRLPLLSLKKQLSVILTTLSRFSGELHRKNTDLPQICFRSRDFDKISVYRNENIYVFTELIGLF